MKCLLGFIVSVVILAGGAGSVAADPSLELAKFLPAKVGGFRQVGPVRPSQRLIKEGLFNPEAATVPSSELVSGEVEYRSEKGKRLTVELFQFRKDSDAYSLLTQIAGQMRDGSGNGNLEEQVGTASADSSNRLVFFKGNTVVRVSNTNSTDGGFDEILGLARLVANGLDKGEGEIPVLVKHLPEWQDTQRRALYFSGGRSLQTFAPDQPVLASLNLAGDADAVAADYGAAKLLIIEFNTPQLAGDNDRQITTKLQEFRSQNQKVPTAYRRVGNYSVFVFNAASEQAANELIDKIQYEQVVQWLGDNPYWLKEAQRRYTETTLGVLVAVVKASGLTLVGCFGLGGLIGATLFIRRRARQATAEAFSDAGGMLRLNLDEMTPQTDPSRLLADRN